MTPWWAGLAPATSAVRCGPGRHRLRWEEGHLVALDHADPDGEALLATLGRGEPACLAVLRDWRDHAADPRILTVGARHPGDLVAPTADTLEWAERHVEGLRLGPAAEPQVAAAEADLALLRLLALDAPLQRRLQAEVAANLAGGDASQLAALDAATAGRLLPVLRRWCPGPRWDVGLGPPGVAGGPPPRVTVGAGWLAGAWGRYLALVGDLLVIEVHGVSGDGAAARAEVTAVRAPGEPAVRLAVTGPAPWRVDGEAAPRSPDPPPRS